VRVRSDRSTILAAPSSASGTKFSQSHARMIPRSSGLTQKVSGRTASRSSAFTEDRAWLAAETRSACAVFTSRLQESQIKTVSAPSRQLERQHDSQSFDKTVRTSALSACAVFTSRLPGTRTRVE